MWVGSRASSTPYALQSSKASVKCGRAWTVRVPAASRSLSDAVTNRRAGNDEIDCRVLERVLLVWANLARRGVRRDEEEDVPEHPEPVLKAARLFVRELERHCRTWAILTFNFVESGPFDARLIPEGVRSSTLGSIGSPHATATQGRSSNRRSSSSRPITPTECAARRPGAC